MGRPPKNVLARREKGGGGVITVMGNKRFVLTLQEVGVTPERLAKKIDELLDAEKEIIVVDPVTGSKSHEMVPDHAVQLRTLSLVINNVLRMKKVSEDPGGMNEDDKALMEMIEADGE